MKRKKDPWLYIFSPGLNGDAMFVIMILFMMLCILTVIGKQYDNSMVRGDSDFIDGLVFCWRLEYLCIFLLLFNHFFSRLFMTRLGHGRMILWWSVEPGDLSATLLKIKDGTVIVEGSVVWGKKNVILVITPIHLYSIWERLVRFPKEYCDGFEFQFTLDGKAVDREIRVNWLIQADFDWDEILRLFPAQNGVINIWKTIMEEIKTILDQRKSDLEKLYSEFASKNIAEHEEAEEEFNREVTALLAEELQRVHFVPSNFQFEKCELQPETPKYWKDK